MAATTQPTKVQQRILDLIDDGKGAAEIAKVTKTKPNTVHNHVRKMKSVGILPKEFSLRRNTQVNGGVKSVPAQRPRAASSSNGRSGLGPAGLKVLTEATQTYKEVAVATEKEAEARRGEIANEIAKHEAGIKELQSEDSELQTVVAAARNVEQGVDAIQF